MFYEIPVNAAKVNGTVTNFQAVVIPSQVTGWAERRGETSDNYAVLTTANYFNLDEFNTGVQRTDTGVVKTLTNGAVISV